MSNKSPIQKTKGNVNNFTPITSEQLLSILVNWKRFTISNRLERKMLPINSFGFDSTGLIFGDDILLTYQYCGENTTMYMFVSGDSQGSITEIFRINHSINEKVQIPISELGLMYLFLNTGGDLNHCDVDNMSQVDNEAKRLSVKFFNIHNSYPDLVQETYELAQDINLHSDFIEQMRLAKKNFNQVKTTGDAMSIFNSVLGMLK